MQDCHTEGVMHEMLFCNQGLTSRPPAAYITALIRGRQRLQCQTGWRVWKHYRVWPRSSQPGHVPHLVPAV
jgi:hypothetical protein